jgi:NAD-dependent deacetylase
MSISDELAPVRERIKDGAKVAVLSGAGISAASGIPTFRGNEESLWSRYRPEELATPQAFHQDPELVWGWYDWRRSLIAAAGPNAAHHALAELEATVPVTIITQNVDGYHRLAGSTRILEYHGSIWTVRCLDCGQERCDERVPLPLPPHCETCGGLLRPGVVWFGEGIDPGVMGASAAATAACDIFLVIGTAGAVYPAAGLVDAAGQAGALVVEFNLEHSGISHLVDVFVEGSAADTVPWLLPAGADQ